MPTEARSKKRFKKPKVKDSYLIAAGIAVAGIALAVGASKIKPTVEIPGGLGFGSFDFGSLPGFDFSELFASNAGSAPNLNITIPPAVQNFDITIPEGQAPDTGNIQAQINDLYSRLTNQSQGIPNPLPNFSPEIPNVAGLPFEAIAGKAVVSILAGEYVGEQTYQTVRNLPNESFSRERALALGTGLSAISAGGVEVGTQLIRQGAVERAEAFAAKNASRSLGAVAKTGLGVLVLPVSIATGIAAGGGEARAVITENTPESRIALGSGAASTAFGIAELLALRGVGAGAGVIGSLAGLSAEGALVVGGGFSAAGIVGAALGSFLDVSLENAGILDPNRAGILDAPLGIRRGGETQTKQVAPASRVVAEDANAPEPGTESAERLSGFTYSPSTPASFENASRGGGSTRGGVRATVPASFETRANPNAIASGTGGFNIVARPRYFTPVRRR